MGYHKNTSKLEKSLLKFYVSPTLCFSCLNGFAINWWKLITTTGSILVRVHIHPKEFVIEPDLELGSLILE